MSKKNIKFLADESCDFVIVRSLRSAGYDVETFEKCSILFKFKEGENFNHPSTICRTYGAGRNTLSILRIKLKLHFVQNVEPDTEIGQKGAFCKGLTLFRLWSPFSSASDITVLKTSVEDKRILLTEDKDFGEWVFAHRETMAGVIFIRFPGNVRSKLGETVTLLVEEHGSDLLENFTVLEPGRARVRKPM